MFVRKKRNKSGTISVHVIRKTRNGSQEVVKTFGSAAESETEKLKLMVAEAYDFIKKSEGPALPLSFEKDSIVRSLLSTIKNTDIQVVGPEMIFGRLYDRIGFNAIGSDLFRHLVICRIFNPGSKLKTVEYLARYLHTTYSVDSIYRFMDELCYRGKATRTNAPDYKSQVERITFDYTRKLCGGMISVCFYDMTTLYFEAAEEDELKKCGFSKDGKHTCPQIFIGLLVTTGGNPIGYEVFRGNIYEGDTIIPLIKRLSDRFNLGKPIVVADAGLLSKRNIKALKEEGYGFILGARIRNEPEAIKNAILRQNLKYGDVVELQKQDCRLIISSSEKRAFKDAQNRQKGLARLQKKVRGGQLTKSCINNRGYNKYLTLSGDLRIGIDMGKFNADAAWDGLKGYVTNTSLEKDEVITSYSNLWYIERAFRMNKFDLAVRPIYHHIENRIKGHICVCFTAYSVLLELERILKSAGSRITIARACELVKTMYAIDCTLPDSNLRQKFYLEMDDEQKELCRLVCG